MPGGREITGVDVRAAARATGVPLADLVALDAVVGPDDIFASYDELAAACPPAAIGVTPGAHAALFALIFGEFE